MSKELKQPSFENAQGKAPHYEKPPPFEKLTSQQKALLVSSLGSTWPTTGPSSQYTSASIDIQSWMRSQEKHLAELPGDNVAGIALKVFKRTFDVLEVGDSGQPHLHEATLRAADLILNYCRPMLADLGLPDTVEGFVTMDRSVICTSRMSKEVHALLARRWYSLFFGDAKGDMTFVGFAWNKVITKDHHFFTCPMCFLYHMALPTLERRRRSVPRTLAFVEALVRPLLEVVKRGERRTAVKHKDKSTSPTAASPLRGPASRPNAPTKLVPVAFLEPQVPAEEHPAQVDLALCPDRVMWLLGASDAVEGHLAQEGYFEDASALLFGEPATLFLIGDIPFKGKWPCGKVVRVHNCTWEQCQTGEIPYAQIVVCCNTGLGTFELSTVERWLPRLADLLLMPQDRAPVVVLTSRCRAEVRGELAATRLLGARAFALVPEVRHFRNLFSGMACDPTVQYDDNGWIMSIRGTTLTEEGLRKLAAEPRRFCELARLDMEQQEELKEAAGGSTGHALGRSVFWGILDLKYDSALPFEARVKILEAGDGRSSHFSGYGAAIKKHVEQDIQVSETLLRRAVLVDNKKLTHDLIADSGYDHLQPRQEAYKREYDKDLADRIQSDLGLGDDDTCVLKLCNRQRGCGVVPLQACDLDEALRCLLQPPEDIEAWLHSTSPTWARTVPTGCFEEQMRHWWSNECPCFIAEELCRSQLTPLKSHGFVQMYDGTLRVGFSLHRRTGEDDSAEKDPAGVAAASAVPEFSSYRQHNLELRWLGGYWKLPYTALEATPQSPTLESEDAPSRRTSRDGLEDQDSVLSRQHSRDSVLSRQHSTTSSEWEEDAVQSNSGGGSAAASGSRPHYSQRFARQQETIRKRTISVARQGTAPVALHHLHDIYASLGDMVQVLFSKHDLSRVGLMSRYASFPEFGAFLVARMALSMKATERDVKLRLLGIASGAINKLEDCPPKSAVRSYLERNLGVMEAAYGRWPLAEPFFAKSLKTMPANSSSRYLQGMYHMECGKLQQAIDSMEQALLLDPDFKAPWINIGVAFLRLSKYKNAAGISQSGLERHPGTAQLHYNLAVASFALACEYDAAGGSIADDMHGYRTMALQNFEVAQKADQSKKEPLWNGLDDKRVALLKQRSIPLKVLTAQLPTDGWRFVSWRP